MPNTYVNYLAQHIMDGTYLVKIRGYFIWKRVLEGVLKI
jgi:hypothetical protein